MSAAESLRDAVKANALRLADDHRMTCAGHNCTISLTLLAELLHLAGFYLSDEEMSRLT